MSLDIALIDKETEEEVRSLNWLRNPFGLCEWAERNHAYVTKPDPQEPQMLYYVCNHWAYDQSDQVDRKLFLQVVTHYAEIIRKLEKGYFWFNVSGYIHIVQPNLDLMPTEQDTGSWGWSYTHIKNAVYHQHLLGVPIEYFADGVFHLGKATSLAYYQEWFEQLVEFAELLQDERYRFYCSN